MVAGPTALLFSGLSRIRRKRIVHPLGVGFEATLTPHETAAGPGLFGAAAPLPSIVRLSRSIGLPEKLADPCGLALRVPDVYGEGRHQDFLLVSSGARPIARHLLLPSRGFSDRPYSCLLPYRIDGKLMLVGAKPDNRPPGPGVGDLRSRKRAGLSFTITQATPGGQWRDVAGLDLGRQLPAAETESLRFNPSHSGDGIEPVGFLNRLRPPAYAGSQEGREGHWVPALASEASGGAADRRGVER